MANYRLDSSFEMIGAFWHYDSPDEKFTGTLRSRKGTAEVLTAPIYTELDDVSLRAQMEAFGSDRPFARLPSICGFTKQGNCTLLYCSNLNNEGTIDLASRQQISSVKWRASRTVMGLHLESADAQSIESGAVHLSRIKFLFQGPQNVQRTADSFAHTIPQQPIEVFKFWSSELGADITLQLLPAGGWRMGKGTQIKWAPRMLLEPSHPESTDWYTSIAFRLENFFSLFMGTSVAVKRVNLVSNSQTGWVVQKVRRQKDRVNLQSWVKCPPEAMSDALNKWLASPDEARPVELTVLGILRKSRVFDETRFLSLDVKFQEVVHSIEN